MRRTCGNLRPRFIHSLKKEETSWSNLHCWLPPAAIVFDVARDDGIIGGSYLQPASISTMIDPSLLGRLSFTHTEPTKRPLPPGRNRLGIAGERDAVLFVPTGLDEHAPVP